MRIASAVFLVSLAAIPAVAAAASWMVPAPSPIWRGAIFAACAFAACVSAAFGVPLFARYRRLRTAVFGLTLTPILLILGAFADMLIVDTSAARIGVAAALFLGCFAYYGCFNVGPDAFSASHPEVVGITFATHAVTAFFILSFASRITEYVPVPLAASSFFAGALCAVLGWETLKRSAPSDSSRLAISAAVGVLCAEFVVAFSLLPTTASVNGAAGVIVFGILIHAAAPHQGTARIPKRDFAFASLLLALVLGTARWN